MSVVAAVIAVAAILMLGRPAPTADRTCPPGVPVRASDSGSVVVRSLGPPCWKVLSPAGEVFSPAPLITVVTPGYDGPVVVDVRLGDGRGFRATTTQRALPWPESLVPVQPGSSGLISVTGRGTASASAAFLRVAR